MGRGLVETSYGFGQNKPIDEKAFQKFLLEIKTKKDSVKSLDGDININPGRYRCINHIEVESLEAIKGVSFWMFRDQRIDDNWALLFAQKYALLHQCPLYVTFFLMTHYSVAGLRQYDFMLEGLKQVEKQCIKLGIQFHLRFGYAKDLLLEYVDENDIDLVVADFMPLRHCLDWIEAAGAVLKSQGCSLYQVDAHNVVPCWVASPKLEFAARTIRPKIHNHLKEFLVEFPPIVKHPFQPEKTSDPVDWEEAYGYLKIDHSIRPVSWAAPGTVNGYRMLYEFITQRLKNYETDRNTPTKHGLSGLSPYYHFGQLSVHRVALCLLDKSVKSKCSKSVEAYIEESVVRRELSDNFCYYQHDYDNINGAWDWARKTINAHRNDKREHIYSRQELEFGKTHDPLWNASQIQLLREGKMHGYLRMYWAKKILEWTPDVETALDVAIYLNDRYELDGRDPNGYVGIMWSMVGVHDRAWTERPIFGKIRYMNLNGCRRKFDVDTYCRIYKSI